MLRYIFHLSDLHIRNGDIKYSRYDEYKEVFDNTIASINTNITNKNLTKDDFIIIITGDIFHNKNNIGNYGLLLYKNFITDLTNIGRVIIIHGNHDKQQSELNQPSLVFSSTFQIHNLTILNETTSFIIDDIGFSYVSVDDTLDYNSNSGRLSILPNFPKINGDVKYKIALFHGTFSKSKLYNGEIISDDNNPYPLEWVKDFDYVLLGDIHKRQTSIYKNKTYYGYSGSLIQQNFGEDILDHGYLIWDLYNKIITDVNVYNSIGYINIKQNDNGDILLRLNGKYDTLLENFIKDKLDLFPKSLEIKTFSSFNFDNLNALFNKYNIQYSILSRNVDTPLLNDFKPINNISSDDNISNIANDDYILSYFNKILPSDKYSLLLNIIRNKETLLLNLNKYPIELHDECSKKNKDINSSIQDCNKSLDLNINKSVFLIKYLEWDGLLCYQDKNWINMHELDSKTFMVKGKNGTGKSAIYDILLLAIWGDNTKMKVKGNSSLSAGMINHKKEKAYTIIDIELNGKIYRIERDFARRKENNLLHVKNSVIYEFINDKELVLLKKESACNDEVKKLFGTMDDFLTTSMITQNVDNDILKFDSKKCLELIDKSYNIDYIYNLYNLFKTTSNKYKDFNRTIENKKQVYQKLVSSNQINNVSDDDINDKTKQLNLLNDERSELLTTFNSITIDIKNPIYITILNTDYDSLIKSITDVHGDFHEDDMKIKKERYNELKLLLKDETDLLKLKSLYTKTIEDELLNMNHINKPCELSILQNEEQQLIDYLNVDYSTYDCNDITLLEQDLINFKKQKSELEFKLSGLISSKPLKVDNPNVSKDDCRKNILKYFKTFKDFNKFISTNNKNGTTLSTDNNLPIVSYNTYKKLISDKILLQNKLNHYKNDLITLEEQFKISFNKQQSITIVNKPKDIINDKNIKLNASSISDEIDNIDIEIINNNIFEFEQKLSYYNDLKKSIDDLENTLSNYNNELSVFFNNDDYKYNPDCEFCCKRPWVNRIKELQIIINKLNHDIEHQKSLYDDNQYNILIKNIDHCNNTIIYYDLLIQWLIYYKYKEEFDTISNQLNDIILNKDTINNDIISIQKQLHDIDISINRFINYSFSLFDTLNNIDLYTTYKSWEDNYYTISSNINHLVNTINHTEFKLNYNKIIKPRIYKYKVLKNDYDKWYDYNSKLKIIRTYELFQLKSIIDIYDTFIEYSYNNNLKPLIKQKFHLNELIKDKEKAIKLINDDLIKYSTLNSYYKDNKHNYDLLFQISNDLNDIIDMLDTIIINFQAFRIELYQKHILNNLISNVNSIIKKLCHSDTKPFKLDFLLNVSKDIIHINWLINDCCDFHEQGNKIISITQASGSQHFIISIALRMCLFLNKNNLYCNQLFIDEGFVSFDKFNLSIVPYFLKNLLSYFHSIILVSHIELIQDNIDDYVSIHFNKSNLYSSIQYETAKKVIKTRNKIKGKID